MIIVTVLATAFLIGFATHVPKQLEQTIEAPSILETTEHTHEEEDENFGENVQMMLSFNNNTCGFVDSKYFTETILIEYPDREDEVIGRWIAASNTIHLMQPGGLDVDTVAHEVSHAVDTIMGRNPGIDPHYAAYIQGRMTACVYRVMMHDVDVARQAALPAFRFAN